MESIYVPQLPLVVTPLLNSDSQTVTIFSSRMCQFDCSDISFSLQGARTRISTMELRETDKKSSWRGVAVSREFAFSQETRCSCCVNAFRQSPTSRNQRAALSGHPPTPPAIPAANRWFASAITCCNCSTALSTSPSPSFMRSRATNRCDSACWRHHRREADWAAR